MPTKVFIVENSFTHHAKAISTLSSAQDYVRIHASELNDYKWWFITEYTIDSPSHINDTIYHYYETSGAGKWVSYTFDAELLNK